MPPKGVERQFNDVLIASPPHALVGWNRATIFRKLRRFRTTFGVHPDDYRAEWIQLDLPKVGAERLRQRLGPDPQP